MNLWSLRSEEAGKACTWDAEGATPAAHGSFTLGLFLWMAPREDLVQTDRQTYRPAGLLVGSQRHRIVLLVWSLPWLWVGGVVPHRTRTDETSRQPNRLDEIHNRQLAVRRRDERKDESPSAAAPSG